MDNLKSLTLSFTTQLRTLLEEEEKKILTLTKNKEELDAYAKTLKEKEEALQIREKELQLNIQKNRERTEILEKRENALESEKTRLQNIMNNI